MKHFYVLEGNVQLCMYLLYSCKREKSCMYDISVQDVLSNIAVLKKNLKE